MNLRTIILWGIYRPKYKQLIHTRPTKKSLLEKTHIPADCVVVKLKGHYVRSSTPGVK